MKRELEDRFIRKQVLFDQLSLAKFTTLPDVALSSNNLNRNIRKKSKLKLTKFHLTLDSDSNIFQPKAGKKNTA